MSLVQELLDVKEQLKEVRVIDIVFFIYVWKMDRRLDILKIHDVKISAMWKLFPKNLQPNFKEATCKN